MDGRPIETALDRIEAALARLQGAMATSGERTRELAARHQALKASVAETLGELDGLLGQPDP